MKQPIIKLENVTKSYHLYHHISGFKRFMFNPRDTIKAVRSSSFVALQDINFEVYQGESVGIVGKNGAGKSTILGILAGVLSPTSGIVKINGRVSPMLELGGGFHVELTGRENIILNGVLLGLTRNKVLEKLEEIIDFSDIGAFIDQPIRVYSSGMLSRLGFSVIAHLGPEILIIDEVLAVGDAVFQEKCLKKISEFIDKGVTIVLVSHSTENIQQICNKVLWIEDQKVRKFGETEKVIEAYLASCQV